MDGWMDRWIDGSMDRWIDGYIIRLIFVQAVYLWKLCIVACDYFEILYATTLTWLNNIK